MHSQPVPLLDLSAQYLPLRGAIQAAMDRVIESQHFILGPEVEAFEHDVAAYSSCAHAVGMSSGSDALLAALMAIELAPGDEVITTPYSFFATAGAIARLGARPVFVDIDAATFNIDASRIEAAITPRTRAIIPVHLFGRMAEMDTIMALADAHHLIVIEDAAQAIGAEYRGRRAGSIGHIGCFSFFPSKNLGAFGDAGLATTNDPTLAERLRLLRGHGAKPKYYHTLVGGNFRLDALQAAVLRVKLPHLDGWTAGRRRNASRYRELLGSDAAPQCLAGGCAAWSAGCDLQHSSDLVLPDDDADGRHIYNQFVIRTGRRDALMAALKAARIGHEIYYPLPLHLQTCFADLGHKPGDFPASECAAAQSLAIPIYPELTDAQLQTVAAAVRAAVGAVQHG